MGGEYDFSAPAPLDSSFDLAALINFPLVKPIRSSRPSVK